MLVTTLSVDVQFSMLVVLLTNCGLSVIGLIIFSNFNIFFFMCNIFILTFIVGIFSRVHVKVKGTERIFATGYMDS